MEITEASAKVYYEFFRKIPDHSTQVLIKYAMPFLTITTSVPEYSLLGPIGHRTKRQAIESLKDSLKKKFIDAVNSSNYEEVEHLLKYGFY